MSTETLNEDDDSFGELSSNNNIELKHVIRKPFIRGSDPRIATCRGKLQNKRSKLNQEINKELRLRAGAENLYKATTNRKLRETVALELSFVNSNLQLLKEQLAELNSSVELYQNDSKDAVIPMIPLGLKETKEIDFREPFKDFILEHYSEDATQYEDSIADLMDMRQAMRTPLRDSQGVALLFRYYNQLYFLERRFFPPDRSLGIYFEWYDSLTGVPSCQRTVAFEKACVLFNIGAVYTQIGTKQDRLTAKGLDSAVDSFLRSAGTFRYIHENFTNAPSMDLGPEMLEMLVQLMLAQARECLFEKLELQSHDNRDIDIWLDLAQEAAQVGEIYGHVHQLITCDPVKDYVPYSWIALVNVKKQHYLALSHYHCAMGILSEDIMKMSASTKETLHFLHVDSGSKTQLEIKVPVDDSERKLLGRAHLRESLVMHEESQRLHRMCRELKGKQALTAVLRQSHDLVEAAYSAAESEDDFREVFDPPRVQASTKFQLSLTGPDFAQFRVEDLFKALGPVAIFSAKHHWTAPRLVQLHRGTSNGNTHHKSRAVHKVIQNGGSQCYVSPSRRDISASSSSGIGEHGFGFSVRGDAPVIIAAVDHNSLADFGGVKEGDFIVGIGEKDVKWSSHEDVVKLIKKSGDNLTLKLVTPMDRNYLKPNKTSSHNNNNNSKGSITTNCSGTSSCSVNSIHSSSSGVSSGGLSTTNHSPIGSLSILNSHKKHTWNPFKRNSVVSSHRSHIADNDNVILR